MSNWTNHNGIMIDVKTLSSKVDASIIGLSGVRFNIDTGVIDEHFHINLNAGEGKSLFGLRIEKSTIDYWQSVPEKLDNLKRGAVTYDEGLIKFLEWVHINKPKSIWTYRDWFDIGVLENSILRVLGADYNSPFKYSNVKDVLTIEKSFGETVERSDTSNPLCECIDQANFIIKFFKDMEE